jgi:HD-GYP domain-containing protein (c-di-GMP phosphodiesterase class II)
MLRISIPNLLPGMTIASPISHPLQPGTMLLNSGVTLDVAMIGKLRETGIREVWIRYPGLHDVRNSASPMVASAGYEVARLVDATFSATATSASVRLDYNAYRAAVTGLLEKLSLHPRATVFLDQMAGHGCASVRHASAVCFISLLVGLRLEPWLVRHRARLDASRAREIANLGVGALLHDVGMLALPEAVRERWATTQDATDPAFREHVRIGFEMVKDGFEPTAAGVVLHHHQCDDGSGFPAVEGFGHEPRALSGERVHPFARIVGLVDTFDRLRFGVNDRLLAEGPPTPVVRVLGQLQSERWRSKIDPVVLLGLLSVVPPFAPGTVVTLSDGRSAVVVDWSPLDPCRPTVRDLTPKTERVRGWTVQAPGERIDLRKQSGLSISRAEDTDVAADLYAPETASSFNLDALMRSWIDRAPVDGDREAA